jgi:hypothetical protein
VNLKACQSKIENSRTPLKPFGQAIDLAGFEGRREGNKHMACFVCRFAILYATCREFIHQDKHDLTGMYQDQCFNDFYRFTQGVGDPRFLDKIGVKYSEQDSTFSGTPASTKRTRNAANIASSSSSSSSSSAKKQRRTFFGRSGAPEDSDSIRMPSPANTQQEEESALAALFKIVESNDDEFFADLENYNDNNDEEEQHGTLLSFVEFRGLCSEIDYAESKAKIVLKSFFEQHRAGMGRNEPHKDEKSNDSIVVRYFEEGSSVYNLATVKVDAVWHRCSQADREHVYRMKSKLMVGKFEGKYYDCSLSSVTENSAGATVARVRWAAGEETRNLPISDLVAVTDFAEMIAREEEIDEVVAESPDDYRGDGGYEGEGDEENNPDNRLDDEEELDGQW